MKKRTMDVPQVIAEAFEENFNEAIKEEYMFWEIPGHEKATVQLFKHKVRLVFPGTGTYDITIREVHEALK